MKMSQLFTVYQDLDRPLNKAAPTIIKETRNISLPWRHLHVKVVAGEANTEKCRVSKISGNSFIQWEMSRVRGLGPNKHLAVSPD